MRSLVTLGLYVMCSALLLGGCAQPAPKPSGNSSPNLQSREIFVAAFSDMLKRDEFYEQSLGVNRTAPGFPAMKQAMTALYTDDVVVDWMLAQASEGVKRDVMIGRLGERMFNGVLRLSDAQAMSLLSSMGDFMGRLSPEQCRNLNAPSGGEKAGGFKRLINQMNPDEVLRLFGGLHQGLRADLTDQPWRPTPSRAELSAMLDALGTKVPGGLYAKPENECVAAASLMRGLAQLNGPQQSHAITFVLVQFGFQAKAAAKREAGV